jgi:putative endonuclease
MTFTLYILFSETKNRYYIGHSDNPGRRINEHNSGQNKSTKMGRPWKIVYQKEFQTKSEAVKEEARLKRMKSRKYIIWYIENTPKVKPG